jgi:hypothetical protein
MNNNGKHFGRPGHIGTPYKSSINHPQADIISYFEEPDAEDCFEVAFFKNGDREWVCDIIPELSLWTDLGPEQYTRVYRYIPKEVVYVFLIRFERRKPW